MIAVKKCPVCGSTFTANYQRIYCSKKCHKIAAERNRQNRIKGKYLKSSCAGCIYRKFVGDSVFDYCDFLMMTGRRRALTDKDGRCTEKIVNEEIMYRINPYGGKEYVRTDKTETD